MGFESRRRITKRGQLKKHELTSSDIVAIISTWKEKKAKVDDTQKCMAHPGVTVLGLLHHLLTWSSQEPQRGGLKSESSQESCRTFFRCLVAPLFSAGFAFEPAARLAILPQRRGTPNLKKKYFFHR